MIGSLPLILGHHVACSMDCGESKTSGVLLVVSGDLTVRVSVERPVLRGVPRHGVDPILGTNGWYRAVLVARECEHPDALTLQVFVDELRGVGAHCVLEGRSVSGAHLPCLVDILDMQLLLDILRVQLVVAWLGVYASRDVSGGVL